MFCRIASNLRNHFQVSSDPECIEFFGICLSRYPALALARRPMPQFVFDDPGASLHLPVPLFSLYLPALAN